MRRYPLPPPAMWPCERPLVHVLNGDYPAADLRRMSVPGLERLVAKLVQRTSKAASRPQWWPRGLVFTHPIDLGLSSEREIKLAFKHLIVSCCQFFKASENRRRRPASNKQEFLGYFRLHPRKSREGKPATPPPPPQTCKLASCVHIPFSSDVGRIMATREQHGVSEELKMRRLERSEWYTNKEASRSADVEYEVTPCKETTNTHFYRMPRRQYHHKRRSLHDVNFLTRFCTPCSVVVEKLDLSKVISENSDGKVMVSSDDKRELIVKITDTEKNCCDVRRSVNVKLIRTSPRLRVV